MPALIETTKQPVTLELRNTTRATHRDWLQQYTPRILAAAALPDRHGGVITLDIEDRVSAEASIAEDCATHAALFASVELVRWRRAFYKRQCVV